MLTESLTTTLSTEVLTYHPEGPPVSFEVTVHNTSSTFASFQLELTAAGAETQAAPDWYRVAPEVSSKIPAGARTRFQVDLLAIPPVPSGFSGTMNLNVRVFSLELRNEDRRVLRLAIQGSSRLPPRLVMPNRSFQTYPSSSLEIPLQVQNLNRQAVDVTLNLQGLPLAWFPDGVEKHLHLPAGKETDVQFVCQLPQPAKAPKGSYDILIEAKQPQTMAVQTEATLTVLPQGHVVLDCPQPKATLPPEPKRWRNPAVAIASFDLQASNQSNGDQQLQTAATYESRREQQQLDALTAPDPEALGIAVELEPQPVVPENPEEIAEPSPNWQPRLAVDPAECTLAPGEARSLTLTVCRRLPWLGWPRRQRIQVQGALSDPTVDFRQTQSTLDLEIFPVIPFWLQIFSGVASLVLVLLLWWFYANQGHRNTINSLSFSGQGEELLSASDDQSLRRWRIDHREIVGRRQLIRTDKAVRVAQYRPVDNNQLWVGFENGDIKGWDLLLDREYSLSFNRDDRIFDLALPNQGQILLSGHGSGQVLAWDVSSLAPLTQSEPLDSIDLGFAIQSMTLLGPAQSHLAVAGRFNRLTLVNLSGGAALNFSNYPSGDGNQYILDVATASQKPNLLAVADNQGRMSLWNVSNCLPTGSNLEAEAESPILNNSNNRPCELIDDWLTGHGGEPVRTVALSADGCYLVSGGDDGRVMLWPLNSQGRRRSDAQEGQRLKTFRQPVTAVDVLQTPRRVLVAYGLDNGTVKVQSRRIRASNLPPGECSTSSP
ncbi:MAG: hypothetical protein ACFB0C_16390 [Leptolyngbyaceae cyanobacterium]